MNAGESKAELSESKQNFPPISFLTLAYIFGLIIADSLKIPPLVLFALTLIYLSLAPLVIFLKNLKTAPLIFFLIAFLLLGVMSLAYQKSSLERSLLGKLAETKKYVRLGGRIVTEPKIKQSKFTKENKAVFFFKVNRLRAGPKTWKINEWTQVTVNTKEFPHQVGDNLTLDGQLLSPKELPGTAFDYQKYLYRQKIQSLFITESSSVKKIAAPNILLSLANTTREKVRFAAHKFLKGDKEGLLLGILIGDTSRISEKTQEDFKATGLTHILAVSGQNVGMLILIFVFSFRLLKIRPIFQACLIATIVVFYTLVTQSQPSVLRASVMALVGVAAWLLGRQKNLLSALSVTALVLLLYDPFLLFNIGFQLSFVATLAIVLFLPAIRVKLERLPRVLRDLLAVSLAAQLGVTPILIYYFNQLSIISILANVLVVPVTALVLGLGLFASFSTHISSVFATPFFSLLNIFISYINDIAHVLALAPGATIFTKSPPLWGIAAYYVILTGFLLRPKQKTLRFPAGAFVIMFLILMSATVWWGVLQNTTSSRLKVTFFDVGQGDSALIQTPQGNNVLVDGGEEPAVILKKLRISGVRKIDLLILSHPHLDHVGGLTAVVNKYPVGLVLDSGQAHSSFQYHRFLNEVKDEKIPYKRARRGDKLKLGKLRVLILHPRTPFIADSDSDLNNNSVVAKFTFADFSVLFTGDAQTEAQKIMPDTKGNLASTVLKVPHQGSRDAASPAFLKKVAPRVAIVPVGENNPYGHPAQSTLTKLRSLGTRVYRTDRDGTVTVTSDGKNYRILAERNR